MGVAQPIYAKSDAGDDWFLAQGEIVTNIIHAHIDLAHFGSSPQFMTLATHPFAIILSQGCDLEQDYNARQGRVSADKAIPTVLFCELETAEELRRNVVQSAIWNRIKQNLDERYHFFQMVEQDFDLQGEGLPELGSDFKRIFAIPTDEVYHRIKSGEAQRRCHLGSPYLEHFCSRFANFLSRVALPLQHSSV